MLKKTTFLKSSFFVFLCLSLSACEKQTAVENLKVQDEKTANVQEPKKNTNDTEQVNTKKPTPKAETKTDKVVEEKAKTETDDVVAEKTETKTETASSEVEEIGWAALVPADYDPNKAIMPYLEELNDLQDDDQEAMVLQGKIQAELDNAPVNMSMDGKTIKMPGFIAPLENENGVIDEFLLVPYFGACIHSPAPPINQTVMVKTDKGQGVKSENSSLPVWITGKLVAVEERTDIGAAGYRIENALIEPYNNDRQ